MSGRIYVLCKEKKSGACDEKCSCYCQIAHAFSFWENFSNIFITFFIGLHVVINIKKNLFVQSFKKVKSPVELFMRSFYWKKRHSPVLLGSLGSLISFRLLHIVKLDSKQIKQNGIKLINGLIYFWIHAL